MNKATLAQIARFKLLVGFLGEQSQFNWWPSAFFAPSSSAFLAPVFNQEIPQSLLRGYLAKGRA
jgi:hypothetical protein